MHDARNTDVMYFLIKKKKKKKNLCTSSFMFNMNILFLFSNFDKFCKKKILIFSQALADKPKGKSKLLKAIKILIIP